MLATYDIVFVVEDSSLNGGTEILARNLVRSINSIGITACLVSASELRKKRRLKFAISEFARKCNARWIVNHTYDLCADIPTDGPWKIAQVFNWSVKGYEESILRLISKKPFLLQMLSRMKFEVCRRMLHRALPKFTRLIALTDAGKFELKHLNRRISDRQLVTIPNPIMKSDDSIELTTLCNNKVVFVGRLSHEKGVMRLLRIWERVKAKHSSCKLEIYGDGFLRSEMERIVCERGLSDSVEFMGFVSDHRRIYLGSDLLLMTSDTEGFGMVLIEAMYYGVPCISFDCPVSPKEILGNAGVTVPCFDEVAYADEVVKLLNNKALLLELQHAAIIRARDFYINEIVGRWSDVLS